MGWCLIISYIIFILITSSLLNTFVAICSGFFFNTVMLMCQNTQITQKNYKSKWKNTFEFKHSFTSCLFFLSKSGSWVQTAVDSWWHSFLRQQQRLLLFKHDWSTEAKNVTVHVIFLKWRSHQKSNVINFDDYAGLGCMKLFILLHRLLQTFAIIFLKLTHHARRPNPTNEQEVLFWKNAFLFLYYMFSCSTGNFSSSLSPTLSQLCLPLAWCFHSLVWVSFLLNILGDYFGDLDVFFSHITHVVK